MYACSITVSICLLFYIFYSVLHQIACLCAIISFANDDNDATFAHTDALPFEFYFVASTKQHISRCEFCIVATFCRNFMSSQNSKLRRRLQTINSCCDPAIRQFLRRNYYHYACVLYSIDFHRELSPTSCAMTQTVSPNRQNQSKTIQTNGIDEHIFSAAHFFFFLCSNAHYLLAKKKNCDIECVVNTLNHKFKQNLLHVNIGRLHHWQLSMEKIGEIFHFIPFHLFIYSPTGFYPTGKR